MATMAKKSATTSMKSICLFFGTMILLTSSLFSAVECRALRSDSTINKKSSVFIEVGCDQPEERADSMILNNSSGSGGGSAIQSLMFKLASGPSKRGPGH